MGRRRPCADDGFSLVELIVIVIILAILAAMSIVTYLNQRQTAERASAISTLTNTRLAAESVFADESEFPDDPDAYEDEQSAYGYVDGASTSQDVVSVDVAGGGSQVTFAVWARDRCFYLRMQQAQDLVRATGPLTGGGCSAADFPDEPTGEWR